MKRFFAGLVLAVTAFSSSHGKEVSHRKAKCKSRNHGEVSKVPVKFDATLPSLRTSPAKFNTVVIDAGHGGHDAGGIKENIIPEKDVALDIAVRLSYVLQDAGFKVVLTRHDDTFVTLEDRVAVANSQENAIFVSIHFNATPRREARGIETYYPKSSPGAVLATRIQQNLAATTTGENRGTKAADFFVLRKNKDLAVLVECGFLTNPEDVALAENDDYRENVANQISAAIVEYRASLP